MNQTLLLAAATSVALNAAPVQAQSYNGLELPPYSVEQSDGTIELRRYASHLMAEVRVPGSRPQAAGRGFRALAGYIFGGNTAGQKMKMTAPVVQEPLEAGGWAVRFLMPGKFDEASLPQPNAKAVSIIRQPASRQAVIRFRGRWTPAALAREERKLRGWVKSQGLQTRGPAIYYFYNDPFTLPWKRRNEVALVLQ